VIRLATATRRIGRRERPSVAVERVDGVAAEVGQVRSAGFRPAAVRAASIVVGDGGPHGFNNGSCQLFLPVPASFSFPVPASFSFPVPASFSFPVPASFSFLPLFLPRQ
jgi:hypothetical protein